MNYRSILCLFVACLATTLGCGGSDENSVIQPSSQEMTAEDIADAEAELEERMAEDDAR